MEALKKKITEQRDIKENSLNIYVSNIRLLFNRSGEGDMNDFSLDFLNDMEKIKTLIDGFKLATQKNYLAAILVVLDTDDKLKELHQKYVVWYEKVHNQYIEDYENGEKSKTQEDNWTTLNELRKVMNDLYKDIKSREILKKDVLNKPQLMLLQKYVICNLFLNEDNPPTRLDYAPMEMIEWKQFLDLEDSEKREHNYLVIKSRNIKFFSFNEYKTSNKYGQNDIRVGKKLNSVLNIWLKYNLTDSLLLNTRGKPMAANGLGKELKSIFKVTGKNISVNMLRHIYISEKYPNEDLNKQEDATKMGHSVETQSKYSKR